jgi:hypothetical protein
MPMNSGNDQQPRSYITFGKRREEERFENHVTRTGEDLNARRVSGDYSKSIDQMNILQYLSLCLPNIRLITISPTLRKGTLELFLSEAPLLD